MGKNLKREAIFKFKHFSVKNEKSAMKVGTDGVLLGAWCDVSRSSTIIDVGAGTGLISLMLAQRCDAKIYGVEIDNDAADEAVENVANSKWKSRIEIINADFLKIYNSLPVVEHIVSNPPFFLLGEYALDNKRATARHATCGIDYVDIINATNILLSQNGKLSLISPMDRYDDILFTASIAKLNLSRLTTVYSMSGKNPIRLLWEFTRENCIEHRNDLIIRDLNNNYTEDYINLTKEYYLKF